MKPLLAHVYEPHRVTYPCYVQPKLNGIRALYQAGRFQSRDELPFAEGLLSHLSGPLREIFDERVILDGELYVHGWPLQRINAAVTPVRGTPTEDTALVEYHVFDVVDFHKSFVERFRWLAENPVYSSSVRFIHTYICRDEEKTNSLYQTCVENGYEGIMYRLGDCPYTTPKQTEWKHKEDGLSFTTKGAVRVGGMARTKFLSDKDNRTWHLLKRKSWQDDEFDFLSIRRTYGEKGEPGFIMTLRAGPNAKKPTFDVGSGLSHADVERLLESVGGLGRVKVKYLCLSEAGIPLNPTILALL